MKQLKLGLPKGSLENATINLFEKAGWLIKPAARNYFPEIDDPDLACSICRPQEMSRYVESGMLDAGITGKDWTMENLSDTVLVCDLVYSKVSRRPTRWIIAVAGNSEIRTLEDLEGKKISTELVNVTRRFFAEKNINVEIEFSWGATEAKVVSGLVDAIVEVTETESTIRAHGLRIIHELMTSNTQFIANKDGLGRSMEEGEDRKHRHDASGRAAGRQDCRLEDECRQRKTSMQSSIFCPVSKVRLSPVSTTRTGFPSRR